MQVLYDLYSDTREGTVILSVFSKTASLWHCSSLLDHVCYGRSCGHLTCQTTRTYGSTSSLLSSRLLEYSQMASTNARTDPTVDYASTDVAQKVSIVARLRKIRKIWFVLVNGCSNGSAKAKSGNNLMAINFKNANG